MSYQHTQIETSIPYGCDRLGRLKSVLLHTPGEELSLINESNYQQWLFNEVPNIEKFIKEHNQYRDLLLSHGVRVYELSDHVKRNRDLIPTMPNLTYLHDVAVISSAGAILSRMIRTGRKNEEIVVKEALNNLGIPIFSEFKDDEDVFEGCLLLSGETMLVANTERHSYSSIMKFIPAALQKFKEVIYVDVPKSRRFMHPDTVFNRVKHDLALAYLPVFKETFLFTKGTQRKIDFCSYMEQNGVKIIGVSDSEQKRLACSFVPFKSGVIFHYDNALDKETQTLLSKKGVEIIPFHPEALKVGGGSLRCITLKLHREIS